MCESFVYANVTTSVSKVLTHVSTHNNITLVLLLFVQNPAKAKKTRKVIIVEALYLNYGDLAPLPKLVELRNKYSTPLIIDESFSFGVLGGTGRGALEHFGLSVSSSP